MKLEAVRLAPKEKCTGCGLCQVVCPCSCITMQKDKVGFFYPHIDESKCINCKNCVSHCPEIKEVSRKECISASAGKTTDKRILKNAASGGAFASIAAAYLKMGGVVYGCYSSQKSQWVARIIRLESLENIEQIYGSKYYESDAKESYKLVKEDLVNGKKVLYGGRPCQVAALYNYLSKTNIDNLLTVDVICHGISSYDIFLDYIKTREYKKHITVKNYCFRAHKEDDESGYFGKIEYLKDNGKEITKPVIWQCDSYYYNYMMGNIVRESCFSCRYADKKRVGDLSLGDFWGIEKFLPGYRTGNINLILINSEKAKDILTILRNFETIEVNPERAIKENESLIHPISKPIQSREEIINLYTNGGWSEVDKRFRKKITIQKIAALISYYTPRKVKEFVRKV